jgi:hypothetical protein
VTGGRSSGVARLSAGELAWLLLLSVVLAGYVYLAGWLLTWVRMAAARLSVDAALPAIDDKVLFADGLRMILIMAFVFAAMCGIAYLVHAWTWNKRAPEWHSILKDGRASAHANAELAPVAEKLKGLGHKRPTLARPSVAALRFQSAPDSLEPAAVGDPFVRVVAGFNVGVLAVVVGLAGARLVDRSGQPRWLYMARHSDEGEYFQWSNPRLTFDEGHPVVQAAFGRHPTYDAHCGPRLRFAHGLKGLVSDWVACGSGRFAFRASSTPLVDIAKTPWACWKGHFGVANPKEARAAKLPEWSPQRVSQKYYHVAGPRSPLWQAENGHLASDGKPAVDAGICANNATPKRPSLPRSRAASQLWEPRFAMEAERR